MSLKLGVVMDPIQTIKAKKDTTLAMLLEAQQRGFEIHYMEQKDLYLRDGKVFAQSKLLRVYNDLTHWFEFMGERIQPLHELDVVLMRKDPPFDVEYFFTTYLLENAEKEGCLVVNKPQSLRDANEKIFTSWFPQCCPETLVTREPKLLRDFLTEFNEIVIKPLGSMGGTSVFHVRKGDHNTNVIIETLTQNGTRYVMSQRFIPAVREGDKRIILIDGKPIPYGLLRVPAADDFRGNLAAGAEGRGMPLTARDYWICEQVGPSLREKGLWFVGLDVIGDYLTEINVTSPTGVRELDKIFNLNISAGLFDCIDKLLAGRQSKLGSKS